jgi:hypothetical protein
MTKRALIAAESDEQLLVSSGYDLLDELWLIVFAECQYQKPAQALILLNVCQRFTRLLTPGILDWVKERSRPVYAKTALGFTRLYIEQQLPTTAGGAACVYGVLAARETHCLCELMQWSIFNFNDLVRSFAFLLRCTQMTKRRLCSILTIWATAMCADVTKRSVGVAAVRDTLDAFNTCCAKELDLYRAMRYFYQ